MQQLSKRNTYTPTDTSLVCSNCGSTLNIAEDRRSVQDLKTSDNTSQKYSSTICQGVPEMGQSVVG